MTAQAQPQLPPDVGTLSQGPAIKAPAYPLFPDRHTPTPHFPTPTDEPLYESGTTSHNIGSWPLGKDPTYPDVHTSVARHGSTGETHAHIRSTAETGEHIGAHISTPLSRHGSLPVSPASHSGAGAQSGIHPGAHTGAHIGTPLSRHASLPVSPASHSGAGAQSGIHPAPPGVHTGAHIGTPLSRHASHPRSPSANSAAAFSPDSLRDSHTGAHTGVRLGAGIGGIPLTGDAGDAGATPPLPRAMSRKLSSLKKLPSALQCTGQEERDRGGGGGDGAGGGEGGGEGRVLFPAREVSAQEGNHGSLSPTSRFMYVYVLRTFVACVCVCQLVYV